jgi:hypothetical protein
VSKIEELLSKPLDSKSKPQTESAISILADNIQIDIEKIEDSKEAIER